MLSFSVVNTPHGQQVVIHADEAGMNSFIDELETLRKNDNGHVHLRSDFAGGIELSKVTPSGNRAIDEVIVNYI